MNPEWKDEEYIDEENGAVEEPSAEFEDLFDEEPAEDEYDDGADEIEEDDRPDEGDVIERLLGFLEDAIQNPSASGFMGTAKIDTEKCMKIIDDIRQNMPVSLQYSAATSAQRERILANAQRIAESKVKKAVTDASNAVDVAKAESEELVVAAKEEAARIIDEATAQAADIIEKAKRKAVRMKNEEEILREAKREAAEIRSTTARNAREVRRKALSDAWLVYESAQRQLKALSAKLDTYKNELPDDESV